MVAYPMWAADAYNITVSSTALTVKAAIEWAITWWEIDLNAFQPLPNSIDVFIETNSIRWLDTWETPTASLWHLWAASWINVVSLRGIDISNFQMIRATWSDATVSVRIWTSN